MDVPNDKGGHAGRASCPLALLGRRPGVGKREKRRSPGRGRILKPGEKGGEGTGRKRNRATFVAGGLALGARSASALLLGRWRRASLLPVQEAAPLSAREPVPLGETMPGGGGAAEKSVHEVKDDWTADSLRSTGERAAGRGSISLSAAESESARQSISEVEVPNQPLSLEEDGSAGPGRRRQKQASGKDLLVQQFDEVDVPIGAPEGSVPVALARCFLGSDRKRRPPRDRSRAGGSAALPAPTNDDASAAGSVSAREGRPARSKRAQRGVSITARSPSTALVSTAAKDLEGRYKDRLAAQGFEGVREDPEEDVETAVPRGAASGALASKRDSGSVASANAQSAFKAMSTAVNAEEWNSKFHVGLRMRSRQVVEHRFWTVGIFIATCYALLGTEVLEAATGSSQYTAHYGVLFAILLVFLAELVLQSIGLEGYLHSFFFYLDVVGTLSIVPDIPWLWPEAWDMGTLAIARAGRVARTGTRAVRLIRFVRILRMVRLVRVLKCLKFFNMGGAADDSNFTDEIRMHRTRLAQKHATVVEMRVVGGVILMLMVLPNLEYEAFHSPMDAYLPLLQAVLSWSGAPTEDVFGEDVSAAERNILIDQMDATFEEDGSLVYLEAGGYVKERALRLQRNVISTRDELRSDAWRDVVADYDLTGEVIERAWLSILLTIFLVFLFGLGAFVFNRDAHNLMLKPFARLQEVTSSLASTVFSINPEAITGCESSYLEAILTKVSRFFELDHHKITMLYTPNNHVWTIDVKKEAEETTRIVGSSHRITVGDLQNLMRGGKKDMVRRLMFKDFLTDPLAMRYFHTFLQSRSDRSDELLVFFEEVQRYRGKMADACSYAARIYHQFLYSDERDDRIAVVDADAVGEDAISRLYYAIFSDHPTEYSFNLVEQHVLQDLQERYFPAFLDSDVCRALITAKSGLPKAIMVETEYEYSGAQSRRVAPPKKRLG